MLKHKKSLLKNEKGMASIEMIPILIVIVFLISSSFGFFGAVHSGILNSIASRNYAFETFQHRANLRYFRNNSQGTKTTEFFNYHMRLHATRSEESSGTHFVATKRPIDLLNFKKRAEEMGDESLHKKEVVGLDESKRNENISVNPIWIKTAYGICLDANCGS